MRAFDGARDTYFWGLHEGGGVRAGDAFTIELDSPKKLSRVFAITGSREHPDDEMQHGVLEVSTDGKKFENATEFKRNGTAEVKFDEPREIKAVRIRATEDQKSWLIVREFTLE